jgi:tetratricopeptide (TPR) repeat protein
MKANNCQNLGFTLKLQGNFAKARQWYQKAVELGKVYNLYEILYPCNTALVQLYWKALLPEKALFSAQETLQAATVLGLEIQIIEAKLLEAKVCKIVFL